MRGTSYESTEELKTILGHMGTAGQREGTAHAPPVPEHPGLRTLFVLSGADEYVPPSVDTASLAARMVAAAGGAANGAGTVTIEGASHNLAKPEGAAGEFVAHVCEVLEQAAR